MKYTVIFVGGPLEGMACHGTSKESPEMGFEDADRAFIGAMAEQLDIQFDVPNIADNETGWLVYRSEAFRRREENVTIFACFDHDGPRRPFKVYVSPSQNSKFRSTLESMLLVTRFPIIFVDSIDEANTIVGLANRDKSEAASLRSDLKRAIELRLASLLLDDIGSEGSVDEFVGLYDRKCTWDSDAIRKCLRELKNDDLEN